MTSLSSVARVGPVRPPERQYNCGGMCRNIIKGNVSAGALESTGGGKRAGNDDDHDLLKEKETPRKARACYDLS